MNDNNDDDDLKEVSPGLWIGGPVKPGPVSENFIQDIENAGARPEFVAALRKDLAKHQKKAAKEKAAREKRLRETEDFYKNAPPLEPAQIVGRGTGLPNLSTREEEPRSLAAPVTIIGMGLLGLFMIGWASCQSNTEPATSSPTTVAPSHTE